MAKKATYITQKEGLHPVKKRVFPKAKKDAEYYRGVIAGPKAKPKEAWGGRRTNRQASPVVGQTGDSVSSRVAARKEAEKILGLERIGETIKKKKKKK